MTIATALVSGNEPLPQLVEEAVARALAKSDQPHARSALLFLTPEFTHHDHARQAITAAARAASCLQIAGGIASGVLTEEGWAVDRPAAAIMLFCGDLSPAPSADASTPTFSYAGGNFPPAWREGAPRFGSTFSGNAAPPVWQQGRLIDEQRCELQFPNAHIDVGVSCGLRLLGSPQRVERSNGYDLNAIGGHSAQDSLRLALPPELRPHLAQSLHQLTAVLLDDATANPGEARLAAAQGRHRPLPIIAANSDSSLTLGERVAPGQYLNWAIREPSSAEADMRRTLDSLAASDGAAQTLPACALMFSCIGRGPYFYGRDDRDLAALLERFPGLPVIGTYGTGQIAPSSGTSQRLNRHLQNAVVTALIRPHSKEAHVQSLP
ncbi:FIST C-terminal domain-containing protein [Propionivibrio limicola]|uniref:FIST C-terminal domain-containing protein n=1 Tax=Propionivibrio limicola TaxID=167645 RepID=UPI0014787192|nr:FIST C-terminal domain-containing protein [Propionivibrio limicola]